MSGGHWDYRQYALNDLLDGVRRDLDRAGKADEFGHKNPDDPRLLAGLRLAEVMLEATDQLVHDLDWCLSGDTSPDTLETDLRAWREKFALRLRGSLVSDCSEKEAPAVALPDQGADGAVISHDLEGKTTHGTG